MGRKKKGTRVLKGESKPETKEGNFTADDLLNKVDEFMDIFQFDLALKFCERAIKTDPENLRALETAGNIYAELGDLERARGFFNEAVLKSPSTGYQKYMYLGQLSDGEESIKYYVKGIEIIRNMLQQFGTNTDENMEGTSKSESEAHKLRRDESNAYCSIAEVYLTDSCFVEEAESHCEKYCNAAIASDSSNPEAYFAFANFLLSKGDTQLAKEMACKSLDMWAPSSEVNEDEQTEENGAQSAESSIVKPSFESRLNLSKIFIELKEYSKAKFVLIGLLEENDEDLNILYLLGLTDNLDGDFQSSNVFLENAKELIEKFGCDDDELIAQLDELIETNKTSITNSDKSNGLGESDCEEEEEIGMETDQ